MLGEGFDIEISDEEIKSAKTEVISYDSKEDYRQTKRTAL